MANFRSYWGKRAESDWVTIHFFAGLTVGIAALPVAVTAGPKLHTARAATRVSVSRNDDIEGLSGWVTSTGQGA